MTVSRTTRKRKESFEAYYKRWLICLDHPEWFDESPNFHTYFRTYKGLDAYIKSERYKYKTSSDKHYSYSLPKYYRNMINQQRRARDKVALWRELNYDDGAGNFSKWNCKDSNSWGYW